VYVHALILPVLAVDENLGVAFVHGALLLTAMGILGVLIRLPLVRLARITVPEASFWALVIIVSAVTDAFIVLQFGLHLRVLSLGDILNVYDLRLDYRYQLSQANALVAYAIGWQSNVLNPLLIVRELTSRKPFPLLMGALGQLGIFEITGFKSLLFSTVLILV